MAESIESVIRMAGHLLEHHSTQGHDARDASGAYLLPCSPDACSWCLYGAVAASATSLWHDSYSLNVPGGYETILRRVLGLDENPRYVWDHATPEEQQAIIEKMKNYATPQV